MDVIRNRITVDGKVQGVGFRPYVYHLCVRHNLSGFVCNTGDGVVIEIQGLAAQAGEFPEILVKNQPPLAEVRIRQIESIAAHLEEKGFVIADSRPCGAGVMNRQVSITPDAALCNDCLRELYDPADRRYRYPFINCTQCGPRFTIVSDIPYDRDNTTMRDFIMCRACQKEYEDPFSRRFHAEPNACPECGPQVQLIGSDGAPEPSPDPVRRTVELLEAGQIVAVKGLGGFHLAARADDNAAVERLRERKYRKAKAFALMARDLAAAERIVFIDEPARSLLGGITRPIVLCLKKEGHGLSEPVAPRSRRFGIMLPYTPLHVLLMEGNYPALVMTSGNTSDEPIESDNAGAREFLGGIADYFLLHNRTIYTACDDSVARIMQGQPQLIRRARGYVPEALQVERQSQAQILAVGSDLKNTLTILKGGQAYVSQHTGDVENVRTHQSMIQTAEKFLALTGVWPDTVACDLHPAMATTHYARSLNRRLIAVQHHHAHIAAVMGEHHLPGPVIGLAMDGLGYGADGVIWGGELLRVWRDRFERLGHISPLPQPGGDAASRQPWRMALSALYQAFGPERARHYASRCLRQSMEEVDALLAMMQRKVNCPATTSLGRLFDAVSSLAGICQVNSYEAQAAIELEYLACEGVEEFYPPAWKEEALLTLDTAAMMRHIITDLEAGVEAAIISARFHNYVIEAWRQAACRLATRYDCPAVCLAGGVFQNERLLSGLATALQKEGLQVYYNRILPVNDGSISFGQAIVADAILGREMPRP